ncbi:hypothetical protein FIBSPDRAFT_816652 [Athelia psychrophila]|uniref:V-SNARE coiled-coil homology domain-containing protein n=1 Tax=Athelia psychrophila TaxID=1759441 RepID=A0A166S034_9AGAM|nr:hypothetical protein FIBSPDRAFT_816652 [Fibularhizoctonia sp. CBS 109695]
MFSSKHEVHLDLSTDLREMSDWKIGVLGDRPLEYLLNATSLAFDPVSGLLAVGTSNGIIYIYGKPGVICRLALPAPLRVNFLQFAVSLSKLTCIDEGNQLHVWDLASTPHPKLQKTARFGPVNSLTLTASHTHAFVALQSGEIRTYDLLCLRKSPYTIPNMWALYEEQMAASGVADAAINGSQMPTDVVIHPRDLNLAFVAYGGGVVLSDLTQRSTLRAYELVIPAGAPGGAGYNNPNLLTHRRPPVTSIAIHPAGHFFAVGHTDGTIAFWAIEDEDHPLFVRTLDDLEEVNVVDGEKIEQYLPSGNDAGKKNTPAPVDREPIFKLSWSGFPNSDPRGGHTALTVLGGLLPGDTPGVSVLWLPPFNPAAAPASPTTDGQKMVNPFIRKAMRESLLPTKSYFYSTTGPTQDFLLVPRSSPHFAGAFDPVAIILLSDTAMGTRATDTFQFPPPEFEHQPAPATPTEETQGPETADALERELASTLQAMTVTDEPAALRLPPSLCGDKHTVLSGEIHKVESDVYEKYTTSVPGAKPWLPIEGGTAWTNETRASEARLSKYQPHRILITKHKDPIIQFHDISAQLLLSDGETHLERHFPDPLSALTIDLEPVLTDHSAIKHMAPTPPSKVSISLVRIGAASLDCAVVLSTGELIMYQFTDRTHQGKHRPPESDELLILEHVPRLKSARYHPYFMLAAGLGTITACELCDHAFLAVAYADGALFIMDTKMPSIIFRADTKSKHKRLPLLGKSSDGDAFTCLTWTLSRLSENARARVRLIATRESGRTQVFTLKRASNLVWGVEEAVVELETAPHPLASFIIDAKTGARVKVDKSSCAAYGEIEIVGAPRCMWVTAGAKGAKCFVDVDGERIGKVEWGSKVGAVETVQVVEKSGSTVLVAFTDKNEALIYSLPHLEFLQNLRLPGSDLAFSIDPTGDFLASSREHKSSLVRSFSLCSLFNVRRSTYAFPDVDLASRRSQVSVPAPPKPVSAGPPGLLEGAWSWLGGGAGLTGDQIDALLAGPDRPLPVQPKIQQPAGVSPTRGKAAEAAAEASSTGGIYERLTSALNERGQALGDLEDRFNSLQEGSQSMVDQAKRLAVEQSAKSWFKFGN